MARIVLLVAATLCAQPVLAGDALVGQDERYPPDWSGAYAGAFGGMGISSGHADLYDYGGVLLPLDVQYGLFPNSIGSNDAGGLAGVLAGVNFQSGNFVGGIEGDFGYAWTSAHNTYSRADNVPGSPFSGVSTNTRYETDFGAIATLRARVGYAFDNTVIYGTAGVAAGHVSNRFALSLAEIGYTSPDWSTSGVRFGYAVGFGVEHQITGIVTLRFETTYINLANKVVHATDPAAFPRESISYRFSNDIVMPRAVLSFRF